MAVDMKSEENARVMRDAIAKERKKFPVFVSPVMGEKWKKSSYLWGRKNPARLSEMVSATAFADERTMQEAVRIAKEGQKKWARVSPKERIRILKRVLVVDNTYPSFLQSPLVTEEYTGYRPTQQFFELASPVTLNNGFSQDESLEEAREVVNQGSLVLHWAQRNLLHPEPALYQMPGETNVILRGPVGIVGAIEPYNFPQAIPAADIFAALVNGNSVLFKPSEKAVLPGLRLCELFWNAGVPKDVLLFLPGEGKVAGQYIASCPDVFFRIFTGSPDVGFVLDLRVAEARVRHKKMLRATYLETGGKNCIYVDRNIDIRRALPFLIQAQYSRGGQKCSANSVVLVHKDKYDAFCAMYKECIETFFYARDPGTGRLLMIGDPSESMNIFLGPMIDKAHKEKVEQYIALGKQELKTLVEIDLRKESYLDGHFVGPIAFYNVPENHVIATQEIFGPVIGVIPVRDEDHAVEFVNSRNYDLTRSDFSNLRSVREKFKLEANDGVGYSGKGTTGHIPGQGGFGGCTKSTDSGPTRGSYEYASRFCSEKVYNCNERFYGKIVDAESLGIE